MNTHSQASNSGNSGHLQGHGQEDLRRCIDACTTCHRACMAALQDVLNIAEGEARDHARLLMDCAQICSTSADFMLRGSPLHHQTCGACAAVCRACEKACEAMGPSMKACAEACRVCAESCESMAA
jgi:hypothetical protein